MNEKDQLIVKLSSQFSKEIDKTLGYYKLEDRIFITESILRVIEYLQDSENKERYKNADSIFDDLLKRYRADFQPIMRAKIPIYFNSLLALVELGIQPSQDFNKDESQGMTETQFQRYLSMLETLMRNNRRFLYMEEPEPESKPVKTEVTPSVKEPSSKAQKSQLSTAQIVLFFELLQDSVEYRFMKSMNASAFVKIVNAVSGKSEDTIKTLERQYRKNNDGNVHLLHETSLKDYWAIKPIIDLTENRKLIELVDVRIEKLERNIRMNRGTNF